MVDLWKYGMIGWVYADALSGMRAGSMMMATNKPTVLFDMTSFSPIACRRSGSWLQRQKTIAMRC
jgi:hypothetical protein